MSVKDKSKGFISEFKTFITRGNVMDMAVGLIVGSAFTAIVNSLVNQVIMPPRLPWCTARLFSRW